MKSVLSAAPRPIKHGNSGLWNCHSGSIKFETEGDAITFLNQLGEEHGSHMQHDLSRRGHLSGYITKRKM